MCRAHGHTRPRHRRRQQQPTNDNDNDDDDDDDEDDGNVSGAIATTKDSPAASKRGGPLGLGESAENLFVLLKSSLAGRLLASHS